MKWPNPTANGNKNFVFKTVWFIHQNNLYQTKPSMESKYKRWLKHLKLVFGVTRDQISYPKLEGLNSRERTKHTCAWEVVWPSASTFYPHTIFWLTAQEPSWTQWPGMGNSLTEDDWLIDWSITEFKNSIDELNSILKWAKKIINKREDRYIQVSRLNHEQKNGRKTQKTCIRY